MRKGERRRNGGGWRRRVGGKGNVLVPGVRKSGVMGGRGAGSIERYE